MEREKIIKEMEAILEQELIKIANTVEEFAKLQKVGITRCNAEALCNANCMVVPDGAVVLTREELVKVTEDGYIFDTTKGNKINIIEMAREQARKETANEFLGYAIRFTGVTGYVSIDNLKDVAKKVFGVEVKE